jgi:hypothetical protein
MRAYVATTGVVFALILIAHALRLWSEGSRLITNPPFIFTSLAAIGLFVWAIVLLKRLSQSSR